MKTDPPYVLGSHQEAQKNQDMSNRVRTESEHKVKSPTIQSPRNFTKPIAPKKTDSSLVRRNTARELLILTHSPKTVKIKTKKVCLSPKTEGPVTTAASSQLVQEAQNIDSYFFGGKKSTGLTAKSKLKANDSNSTELPLKPSFTQHIYQISVLNEDGISARRGSDNIQKSLSPRRPENQSQSPLSNFRSTRLFISKKFN